ncbi:helix-turn-helix domain-containing protein [bacterium]|nr:helix-turn-helix domain-containing protein [bacterium]
MNMEYFSVRTASEFCSLSQRFLYKLVQERELKSYRVRGKILIKKSDLEALIIQGSVMNNDELREKLQKR